MTWPKTSECEWCGERSRCYPVRSKYYPKSVWVCSGCMAKEEPFPSWQVWTFFAWLALMFGLVFLGELVGLLEGWLP